VSAHTAGGAGYVTESPEGATFADLVEEAVTSEHDVVIFFGSRNDPRPAGVEAAAGRAFEAVRAVAPGALLLVVGPPWVDDDPPMQIRAVRTAVRAAAEDAGAAWVDPLANGWFTGAATSLIGADGIHPTDEGHVHIAERLQPVVAELVDQVR
jgi:lysophospholipase L1-like esterase